MTSERTEALETALAHAEAAIEDLSDEVRRQGDEIDLLKRRLERLTRTMETMMEDAEEAPPAHQPPPHY